MSQTPALETNRRGGGTTEVRDETLALRLAAMSLLARFASSHQVEVAA